MKGMSFQIRIVVVMALVVLGLPAPGLAQLIHDPAGPAPELLPVAEIPGGALASGALPDGNHAGGCADGPDGMVAGAVKAGSLATDPGVAYIGKKIEIPLVFNILYDPAFPTDWYEWLRQVAMDDRERVCTPNVMDGTRVTEASVHAAIDQLNEFYGQHHITFKLHDGVSDPIRYIPTWAFAAPFYVGADYTEDWFRAQLLDAFGAPPEDALNIFVGVMAEGGLIGQGAFPWTSGLGEHPWMLNLDFRLMPGVLPARVDGKATDYEDVDITYPCELSFMDQNDVLMHEIGHCLGLFHTWNSSTPGAGGDLADDTPMESEPFRGDGILRNEWFDGLPTLERNTVDDSWYWPNGKDPVDMARNVMNYGTFHRAESEITPGQIENIFRFIAEYKPQFLTKFKPARPAEDKLLLFLDFVGEKFKKGTLTNKAHQGQKIPVYLQSMGTPDDGAEILELSEDVAAIQLSGTSHLWVSEDDLAGPDMDQARETFTLAFFFQLDNPEECVDHGYGPACTLAQIGSQHFQSWGSRLEFEPFVNAAGDLGLIRWVGMDHTGEFHLVGLYWPMVAVTDYWTHLALSWDAQAGVTIHVNGSPWSVGESYGPHIGMTFLRIGAKAFFLGDTPTITGLFGSITQVALYNRVLTTQEIGDLIASGPMSEDLKGNYRP